MPFLAFRKSRDWMSQHTDVAIPELTYIRTDYTALRAYALKIPCSAVPTCTTAKTTLSSNNAWCAGCSICGRTSSSLPSSTTGGRAGPTACAARRRNHDQSARDPDSG